MTPGAGGRRVHDTMGRKLAIIESRSAIREELPPRPAHFGTLGLGALRDSHDRRMTYLRLSVTDRCDLACIYCMPPGGEVEHAVRPELLTFEEIARLVGVFGQFGVGRVRFTGGEPLVRRDVVRMIDLVHRQTGIEDLVLTTNATRLAELAVPLRNAGLIGVNVSIDSLDASRFERLTRGGDLGLVLAGIHAAIDAGLEVKLNTVVMGGQNDDELGRIVDFAWDIGATPRFIELMPLGEAASLPGEMFLSMPGIVAHLGNRVTTEPATGVAGKGPARYLTDATGSGKRVGFITAMSESFCESCNRVRVTARGDVRACLAARRAVSLRDVMREPSRTDLDVAWAIHWALAGKDTGHHFLDAAVAEHSHVGMSLIGG